MFDLLKRTLFPPTHEAVLRPILGLYTVRSQKQHHLSNTPCISGSVLSQKSRYTVMDSIIVYGREYRRNICSSIWDKFQHFPLPRLWWQQIICMDSSFCWIRLEWFRNLCFVVLLESYFCMDSKLCFLIEIVLLGSGGFQIQDQGLSVINCALCFGVSVDKFAIWSTRVPFSQGKATAIPTPVAQIVLDLCL